MSKTIKQVAAYAQELINNGMQTEDLEGLEFFDKMMDFIGENSLKELNNDLYLEDNCEYVATLDFSDDFSKLEAKCYDYDKMQAWKKEWNEYNRTHRSLQDSNGDPIPEDIEPEFTVEVPVTRGFSDTSKRSDTQLTWLDLRIAVDEAVTKHLGKSGKCYPWMLRELCNADEFGLTEDEFEAELEMVCA